MAQPLIIAHRGASGTAPENTMAAFNRAIELGATAIELDIHLTKDGELAVIHDDTVDRTSNGSGLVGEMTINELQQLDAGSWFSDDFKEEKIPTLQEVFEAIPSTIMINVEIKNIPCYYNGIEQKVLDVLQQYKRIDSTVVSSFDHNSLQALASLNPDVRLGLLYAMNAVHHDRLVQTIDADIYSLHPMFIGISAAAAAAAEKTGLHVYPWTVNAEKDLQSWIDAGVSGIITNFPERMNALLKK
ncbi:glycerophosphodiester phosphodiesterase [Aureibacillus halotolerans]|uniref:Glycerophosphoryl diester phosphodiesterase n=1 Tax=Aureibacillus halotolerans TaxID=1508390 RepID=A0A4R6UAY8_9BACI|nr:glycerophosphodiester phosphodiesterase [Aureibacillus halotolerans]TDQ42223.1 glycerophosphoryl diester phosphodiesterase [Aureibacillus halotolerans]